MNYNPDNGHYKKAPYPGFSFFKAYHLNITNSIVFVQLRSTKITVLGTHSNADFVYNNG